LSQQVGLHFKSGRRFYFAHNKVNGQPSISGVKNQQGKLITDRIGNQYVSGAVDAAKNPFLFDLGCNLDTGAMFALFERLGGDVEILVKLIQQPIIQDYLLAITNNKQLSTSFTSPNSKIIENILKTYGYSKEDSEFLVEHYNNSSNKESLLQKAKDKRDDLGDWTTNSKFVKHQIAVLDDFLYFKDAASVVGESIATSKFDTSGPGKDVLQSLLLNENYEQFKTKMAEGLDYTLGTLKEDVEAPYDRLITDTLLDVFYKNSAILSATSCILEAVF